LPSRRHNRTSNQHSPRRPSQLRRSPQTGGRQRTREPPHLARVAASQPSATRHRAPRRRPGWRRTRRPVRRTARTAGRAYPRPPAPTLGTVQGRSPEGRPAAFHRFPRRPRPSLGRRTRALRVPPEFRHHRGLRRPPRVSAARVDGTPARLAPRHPGPHRAPPARLPPDLRAAPRPGPARRDLVLRGPARPVRVRLARARHGPARGRVTIRSARPRPVWARLRRGPRVLFPVSRAVPGNRQAARPVRVLLAARVPAAGGQAARPGPAARMAVRVLAGTRVSVPVVPGPAR
jgi:hypothetical protein